MGAKKFPDRINQWNWKSTKELSRQFTQFMSGFGSDGYEKWIEGEYYQNPKLRNAFTDKTKDIWNVLRKGYPNPLSARDLKVYGNIKENTAQTYPKKLVEQNVIKHAELLEDKVSHISVDKYYFEDLSYYLNQIDNFRFPFAPGYVQYTKKLLDVYSNIIDEDTENKIYDALIDFLKGPNGKIKGISIRGNIFCKHCGYNHEARDFIRAILLHLLDGLEAYPRFIDFIHDEKIIDDNGHKTLINLSTERQFKSPKESVEEWFDGLPRASRNIIVQTLRDKPDITMKDLMGSVKEKTTERKIKQLILSFLKKGYITEVSEGKKISYKLTKKGLSWVGKGEKAA